MTTKLLLFAAFVFCMLIMSANYRKRKKKIVFFGDSITEQGAKNGGYIKMIYKLLQNEQIEDKYEVIGAGISGNTITDLYNRMEKDVLAHGAEIVVIYIGINDVWHKIDPVKRGTEADVFKDLYKQVIERFLAASVKLVLCTPSVIGERTNGLNVQDEDVETYAAIVRNLSDQYDLPLVDLRRAFIDYIDINNMENKAQGLLTSDGVHLNSKGNELVAAEMWKVVQQVIA